MAKTAPPKTASAYKNKQAWNSQGLGNDKAWAPGHDLHMAWMQTWRPLNLPAPVRRQGSMDYASCPSRVGPDLVPYRPRP